MKSWYHFEIPRNTSGSPNDAVADTRRVNLVISTSDVAREKIVTYVIQ